MNYTCEVEINWEEGLRYEDLPPAVQEEVLARLQFGASLPVSYVLNDAPTEHLPTKIILQVTKARDEDRWEPGYLPVVESGLSTNVWGVAVFMTVEPYDGSGGNVIIRDAFGKLEHYL